MTKLEELEKRFKERAKKRIVEKTIKETKPLDIWPDYEEESIKRPCLNCDKIFNSKSYKRLCTDCIAQFNKSDANNYLGSKS